jgi:hypothetical protein
MNKAEDFFYEHAGYSYDPKRQTKEEGRIETAALYARAEKTAKENGWYCEWEYDPDGGSSAGEYDEPDQIYYSARLYNEEGEVLASLGGIDDNTMPYKRVVEAELAVEALAGGHE